MFIIILINVSFSVLYLLVLGITVEIANRVCYKKTLGTVALKRDGKTIQQIISPIQFIRYIKSDDKDAKLKKNFNEFFNSLENGEYYTHTHILILRGIRSSDKSKNIKSNKTKKRSMWLEYLAVGKIRDLRKKVQYYDVQFKIEK